MSYPKVLAVNIIEDYILLITFDNQQSKKYDVSQLFVKKMFEPLKNSHFFKSVQIETGGYALSWGADIDISEYELWQNGQVIEP